MAAITEHYVSAHQDQDTEYEYPPEAKIIKQNVTEIINVLQPSAMCIFMMCLSPREVQLIKAKEKNEGTIIASVEFLDLLMRRKGYWDEFLNVLRNEHIQLDHVAEKLQKDLETYKRENEEEVQAFKLSEQQKSLASEENSGASTPNLKRKLSLDDNTCEQIAKQSRESSDSDEDIKDCMQDPSDVDKLTKKVKRMNVYGVTVELLDISKTRTPRKYQTALAKPAQDGYNTIICAPTGSGKTMVASMIIKSHLEKMLPKNVPYECEHQDPCEDNSANSGTLETEKLPVLCYSMPKEKENHKRETSSTVDHIMTLSEDSELEDIKTPRPKILVIVPRFAILLHVYRELKTALPMWNIAKKSGADNVNLKKIKLSHLCKYNHVVVVTADIFKNAILLGHEKCMDITDPTLIIFDECHYTMNDHSYNIIMTEYLKVKHSSREAKLPQIVGLSASPGAGKKIDDLEAQDNILTLCANLDAEVFETVREEYLEELEQFVKTPTKHMNIVSTRLKDPFSDIIVEIMKELEAFAEIESVAPERGTQEYESLMSLKLDAAIKSVQTDKIKVIEQLCTYNRAIILVKNARMIDGYNYISAEFNKLKTRKSSGILDLTDSKLLETFEDQDEKLKEAADKEAMHPNPKLVQLKKWILKFEQEERQFRGMIFVKTKLLAKALQDWIINDAELSHLNPEILTSIHADKDSGGTTHAQQTVTLKRFKEGQTKVLISTSVGEEGIDIPECNMVIKYNHVTNEIAMVQSRGRARKTDAVELVLGDKTVADKDKVNVVLEEIMENAIKAAQKMNKDEFQNKINKIQKKVLEKRQEKEKKQKDLQNQNKADDILLKCKGCSQVACKVSDIRIYGKCSYINPDLEFKEKKVIIQESDSAKEREIGLDHVFCATCKSKWGITVDCYPCLGLKSFTIEINGFGKSVKQWSKMPCTIRKFYE